MPVYVYQCPKGHAFEVYLPLVDFSRTHACPKHGDASTVTIFVPHLGGGQITEKTRQLMEAPFGRRAAAGFKTVGDIDRALDAIQKNNPHLNRPDIGDYD